MKRKESRRSTPPISFQNNARADFNIKEVTWIEYETNQTYRQTTQRNRTQHKSSSEKRVNL